MVLHKWPEKLKGHQNRTKKMTPTKNIGSQWTNPNKLYISGKVIEFADQWRKSEFPNIIVAPSSGEKLDLSGVLIYLHHLSPVFRR